VCACWLAIRHSPLKARCSPADKLQWSGAKTTTTTATGRPTAGHKLPPADQQAAQRSPEQPQKQLERAKQSAPARKAIFLCHTNAKLPLRHAYLAVAQPEFSIAQS